MRVIRMVFPWGGYVVSDVCCDWLRWGRFVWVVLYPYPLFGACIVMEEIESGRNDPTRSGKTVFFWRGGRVKVWGCSLSVYFQPLIL